MRGRGFVASSHGGKTKKKKKKDEKKKKSVHLTSCAGGKRRGDDGDERVWCVRLRRPTRTWSFSAAVISLGSTLKVAAVGRSCPEPPAKSIMSLLPMFSEGPRIFVCRSTTHVATHFSAAPPGHSMRRRRVRGEAKQWAGARAAVRDSSVISHAADRGA